MPDTPCTIDEFAELVRPLIGLPISLPWKGYGSAIFLDLGQLTEGDSDRHRARGEACISIEWDWRVEDGTSILFGSSNAGPTIQRGLSTLEGASVLSLSLFGTVPELVVGLSNGHTLRSMAMVTGGPEWTISIGLDKYIYVRSGVLCVDGGDAARPLSDQQEFDFALASQAAGRWGAPEAQPLLGKCGQCARFVPVDGEGYLLDYGVCISAESPFDGRAVNRQSGCSKFVTVG